jgi:septum formation protein
MLSQRSIILASASPRRKKLLEQIGLEFTVEASNYPETLPKNQPPGELAVSIAEGKAQAVAQNHSDAIIIAADTLGVVRGRIIGKPHTAGEAVRMLKLLSGKSHLVITGLTVLDTRSGQKISRIVETRVYFKHLSNQEIEAYVAGEEPLDKAGAYAIQGLGAVLIEKIDGITTT